MATYLHLVGILSWLAVCCQLACSGDLDLRVTRGLGPKGYGKVRISVVTQQETTFDDFNFTYSKEFKYRWTKWPSSPFPERASGQPYVPRRYLHSSLVDVPDGGSRLFSIGGQKITVRLPKAGAGARGLVISDPCFNPPAGVQNWIDCHWSKEWGTFTKTLSLLNSALTGDDLDFWMILGDNFYDQNGVLSDLMFSQLSLAAKTKFLSMVIGNHDMWIGGGPKVGDEYDQHGIGMMQYYALDPHASLHDDVNFLDFTLNPDHVQRWNTSLNTASNLLWYNMIGDVGFIGVSGAFPESELSPHLQEACKWLGSASPRPNWVFMLGHWNGGGDSTCNPCPHMNTPDIYRRLRSTPGCKEFGTRLKYQDGHTHCNRIQEKDGAGDADGFLIGASGMSGCSQYGFEYMDSSKGHLHIFYFELDNDKGLHRSDEVLSCIQRFGLPQCTHLATLWFNGSAATGFQHPTDAFSRSMLV